MGADGTYTVFVYMCGADLESDGGLATKDLIEMVDASTNDNVRFIIQTGGAAKWKNNVVSAGELGRYEIHGGNIYPLDPQLDASMGDPGMLSAFLEWGIEYAPAANNIAVYPYYMAFVSRTVYFEIEPSYYDFSSDGKPEFGFLLTEQSYPNLASISTHAWKYLPEENILLDLGIRDAGWYKNFWADTVTCDATGGYHTHYLMDGQPFPQYKLIGNQYNNYNFDTSVYITPVLLNGEPTYLLSGRNIGGDQPQEHP